MNQFTLGKNKFKEFNIDFEKLVNPHILIVGSSGTGKTYTLKKIIEVLSNNTNIKMHLVDGQGDMETSNCSTVMFHSTSDYGINPLKFSSHKEAGGIRKKVRNIINAINKTSKKLGNRQEALLRNALFDLYHSFGFFEDNPNTWNLEPNGKWRVRYPTPKDLLNFLDKRIYKKYFGVDKESVKQFEELKKLNKKLFILTKKKVQSKYEKEIETIEEEIKILKAKMVETFKRGLEKANGEELKDIRNYGNIEVLKSVYDTIDNLFSSQIFGNKEPFFHKDASVWRYLIKDINIDEQKLFVYFLAEELYNKARETGLKSIVREYLIIDEAKKHLDDNEENILMVIAQEARKFGLGQILATQSVEHIPKDIITNSAIKIITGVDNYEINSLSKKFNIPVNSLKAIIPHKTALVSVQNKGEINSNFQLISLNIK